MFLKAESALHWFLQVVISENAILRRESYGLWRASVGGVGRSVARNNRLRAQALGASTYENTVLRTESCGSWKEGGGSMKKAMCFQGFVKKVFKK